MTRLLDKEVEHIIIRTTDFKVHHLLRTKPLHSSQIETMAFDVETMQGEFSIDVIPNIELTTRLLSYGPGLFVLSGESFRNQIEGAIKQMQNLYR